MTDEFTDALATRLIEEFSVDDDLAGDAAARATAFDDEYDLELTVDDVVDRLSQAPYGRFERRWNWWVGDVAADLEDCTDSREFRFAGFDAVTAVQ
jgi:hypothetical protein